MNIFKNMQLKKYYKTKKYSLLTVKTNFTLADLKGKFSRNFGASGKDAQSRCE